MADVDHPKTHVEDDKDATLPRTQPESPKHEGIDPLTESDTMYPAEETRADSEKLTKKQNGAEYQTDDNDPANQPVGSDEQSARQSSNSTQEKTVDQSGDAHAESDEAARDEAPANADGKLPKDSQKVNKVSSDKQNTSPSNKPATPDEATNPDESNSSNAVDKVKASDAKEAKPKTDASTRPTNNYPKKDLK